MVDEFPVEDRKRVVHPSGGRVMTKQADALKSDINSVMSRYVQTGEFPGRLAEGNYGDFSNSVDFHTALNRVIEAQEAFQHLPIAVKKHCHQDPGEFLEMVYDPERRGELEELGLVPKMAPAAAPEAQSENSEPEGDSPQEPA